MSTKTHFETNNIYILAVQNAYQDYYQWFQLYTIGNIVFFLLSFSFRSFFTKGRSQQVRRVFKFHSMENQICVLAQVIHTPLAGLRERVQVLLDSPVSQPGIVSPPVSHLTRATASHTGIVCGMQPLSRSAHRLSRSHRQRGTDLTLNTNIQDKLFEAFANFAKQFQLLPSRKFIPAPTQNCALRGEIQMTAFSTGLPSSLSGYILAS